MLTWNSDASEYGYTADTPFGEYTISIDSPFAGSKIHLWTPEQAEDSDPYYETYSLKDAKAVAQEHYETLK